MIIYIVFGVVLSIQLVVAWLILRSLNTLIHFNLPHHYPSVSVVVCAKNAENVIKPCIESIVCQNYPVFELIVANDFSEDNTRLILEKLSTNYDCLKYFIPSKNVDGKKFALKEAIGKATGEWILLTDADCIVEDINWIKNMVRPVNAAVDLVLSFGDIISDNSHLNEMIRYETKYIASQYITAAQLGNAYMGVGRNMALRRSKFLEVDPLSDYEKYPFGDDDSIVTRMSNGINVEINLKSRTLSHAKSTLKDYFDQKRRHITTSYQYPFWVKSMIFSVHLSHLGVYAVSILLLVIQHYWFAGILLLCRWVFIIILSQSFTIYYDEKTNFRSTIRSDFLLLLTYVILLFTLPSKKKKW